MRTISLAVLCVCGGFLLAQSGMHQNAFTPEQINSGERDFTDRHRRSLLPARSWPSWKETQPRVLAISPSDSKCLTATRSPRTGIPSAKM